MLADKQPIVAWEDLEHMEAVLRPAFTKAGEERAKRNITFKVILRDSRAAREFVKAIFGFCENQNLLLLEI